MRVDQLSAIARAHLGERYEFQTMELFRAGQPRRQRQALKALRGAVVVFLKGSGACFDVDGLARLRAETAGICIDHVDAVVGLGPIYPIADLHIFSSHAGMRAMARRVPGEAAFVTHHADPRILTRDHRAAEAARPGYFGADFNTVVPEALKPHFDQADFAFSEDFDHALARMPEVNLHWAIRDQGWRGDPPLPAWKPFTKGFNAAWAGANVIADRGEDDAVEYLGEDYPYLAEDASEPALMNAFARAEATVGGEEWRRGLERMAAVRARSAPNVVAAELNAALKRFV